MVDRTPKRLVKQAQAAPQPQFNDYFEAMKTGSSEVAPAAIDKKEDVSAQLQALIQRVDQLTSQNDTYRPAPAPQQIQVVAAPAQVAEAIPDPVLNSEAYTAWLIERSDQLVKANIEAFRQEQAEQANSEGAYDRLWEQFLAVDGNEGWEKSPEMVQVAALKVGRKLMEKGIDPNTYMFQNSDKYFKDIRKTLETDFGTPDADGADTTNEADVDRTGGIAGGQTSPVVAAKGADGKAAPDLSADLVAIQRKGGWY